MSAGSRKYPQRFPGAAPQRRTRLQRAASVLFSVVALLVVVGVPALAVWLVLR